MWTQIEQEVGHILIVAEMPGISTADVKNHQSYVNKPYVSNP